MAGFVSLSIIFIFFLSASPPLPSLGNTTFKFSSVTILCLSNTTPSSYMSTTTVLFLSRQWHVCRTRDTLCVGGGGGGGEEIVEICINTCHYTDRYIYMYLQCIYERKKEGNRRPGKCTDPKQKVNYRKKTLSCLGQDSNQRTPKF